MRLIARFTVDGFDQPEVGQLDADWVDVLVFRKTFTDGIVGSATTLFQSAGSEGDRGYVATEHISGRLSDGRSDVDGSVTVQHGGLESDPATWFGHVVPGTGTGCFAGWSGAARIQHDAEGAYFEFELTS